MQIKSGHFLKQLIASRGLISRQYSNESNVTLIRSKKFPNSLSSALKKGSGGRSSFNGCVVTVFGGSGFVASHVVSNLCRMGCQVIVPYRADHYAVAHLKTAGDLGQVLFQPYNLRDEESIYKSVKYSNVVINLVGKLTATPSFTHDDVNVKGARTIAKLAREAGVNRLIHVSALNCSPNPRGYFLRNGSNFLRSKYWGEVAVREEFPEAIIFRPADLYGESDDFFNYWAHFLRLQTDKMYIWNKGEGIFKQPLAAHDLAQGIVNSIFDNEILGKTVDAAGNKRYELQDLVRYMMRATGRGEEYEYRIEDARAAFWFLARVLYTGYISKYPFLSMEKLELECHSDELTPGNLKLEDLGVNLTSFEEVAYYTLKPISRIGYYMDEYGELKEPPHPKSYI